MSIDPIAISRSALDVEWQRLQIIAQNLANQNSSRIAGGGTYRPLTLVSGPRGDFGRLVEPGGPIAPPEGVRVIGIETQGSGLKRLFDPGHPDADGAGFVTMPDVNVAHEMALMVKTARVYESNLTVMSLAQRMTRGVLDLGAK